MMADAEHEHGDLASRGEEGMGFSQTMTVHHFLAAKDGGLIQVTVKDAADKASIEQIRMHMQQIARAFAQGDFSIPMFVHDKTPPGVEVMQRLKAEIRYEYQELPNGANVVIKTSNTEAQKAIKDFLRMQAEEHNTGDPLP